MGCKKWKSIERIIPEGELTEIPNTNVLIVFNSFYEHLEKVLTKYGLHLEKIMNWKQRLRTIKKLLKTALKIFGAIKTYYISDKRRDRILQSIEKHFSKI